MSVSIFIRNHKVRTGPIDSEESYLTPKSDANDYSNYLKPCLTAGFFCTILLLYTITDYVKL